VNKDLNICEWVMRLARDVLCNIFLNLLNIFSGNRFSEVLDKEQLNILRYLTTIDTPVSPYGRRMYYLVLAIQM
jgi:hypothetical protein